MRKYVLEPFPQLAKGMASSLEEFGRRQVIVDGQRQCEIPNTDLLAGSVAGHLLTNADRFLTINQVCEKTTLSRAWIYKKIEEGAFPAQIRLSRRRVVWSERSVVDYMNRAVLQGLRSATLRSMDRLAAAQVIK